MGLPIRTPRLWRAGDGADVVYVDELWERGTFRVGLCRPRRESREMRRVF